MIIYQKSRYLTNYVNGLDSSYNAFVFIAYDETNFQNGSASTVGIAFLRGTCDYGEWQHQRTSINEYTSNGPAALGATIAHEIGHNMGLMHDFPKAGPDHGRLCYQTGHSCINLGGIMDYFQGNSTGWSCCSVNDLRYYYEFIVARDGQFCLEVHSMSSLHIIVCVVPS